MTAWSKIELSRVVVAIMRLMFIRRAEGCGVDIGSIPCMIGGEDGWMDGMDGLAGMALVVNGVSVCC